MRTRWLRRKSLGFAAGSICFALGTFSPYVDLVGVRGANATVFLGSLLFTDGTLLQVRIYRRTFGRPWAGHADVRTNWWGAIVEFTGALAFNVSTLIAVLARPGQTQKLEDAWRPDAFGATCFLLGSGLFAVAVAQQRALWPPSSRAWWAVATNVAGSVAFAVSAVGAYVEPWSGQLLDVRAETAGTFVGALWFLASGLLEWPGRDAGDDEPRGGRETGRRAERA